MLPETKLYSYAERDREGENGKERDREGENGKEKERMGKRENGKEKERKGKNGKERERGGENGKERLHSQYDSSTKRNVTTHSDGPSLLTASLGRRPGTRGPSMSKLFRNWMVFTTKAFT